MNLFKKIKCIHCGLRFSKKEDLMNHEQIVHCKSEYDCKACGESFSSMESMRTHLQKKHSYKKDRYSDSNHT